MKVAELLNRIDERTIGLSETVEAVEKRQIDQDKWKTAVDERIKKLSGSVTSLPGSNEGKDKMVCSIVGTLFCLFPALFKGGNVTFPAGTILEAVTTGPAEINIGR